MVDIKNIDVVIPISERHDDVVDLYQRYSASLDRAGIESNFIFVLDGEFSRARADLLALEKRGERITVLALGRRFGESAALSAGFEECQTEWVLTLPSYYQVNPDEVGLLFTSENDSTVVIGRRSPRFDSSFSQFTTRVFHRLVRWMTGVNCSDLGSGVRLLHKSVVDEVTVYGDQHRFLPILATRRGFKVGEVDVPQAREEKFNRLPGVGLVLRRILDLVSVFFLVKFTKKPLRFFGIIGSATLAMGVLAFALILMQRVIFGVGMTDRPALLIASLMMVLGVQILAIGLVGEIVIFTHASDLKEYTVEKVVGNPDDS